MNHRHLFQRSGRRLLSLYQRGEKMKHTSRIVGGCLTLSVLHCLEATNAFVAGSKNVGSSSYFSTKSSSSSSELAMTTTKSKMDQSFPTWTFDKPCKSMEWTEMRDVALTMLPATEKDALAESDLVVVGMYAPPKEEDDDNNEEDKEEEEEGVSNFTGMGKELDEKLGGALSQIVVENVKEFKNGATVGSMTPTLRVMEDGKMRRYAVVGLGKTPGSSDDDDKKTKDDGFGSALGSAIATKCDGETKVAACSVVLPPAPAAIKDFYRDVSTFFFQDLYSDNRYRTGSKIKQKAPDLESVTLLVDDENSNAEDAINAQIQAGKHIAKGVFMTKDIVNSPHNVLNSESLAETAQRMAANSGGRLKCTILGKEECEQRGMGAYLGVARGSETDPQFIHLTYTPPPSDDETPIKKLGVVGKGLLFDTGGYNIKTAMMELMKFDCGGSAAVLGAAVAIAALEPRGVEVHFIVAACENMINQNAIVPSDILTASNGKTIEIINTDAEGRLTLADALVYADKEIGCDSIIELSTLTGACMVALGKSVCAVFTDNDDLAKELSDASKTTGEKSWRMPLEKSYNEQLKSKIADISNCGTRYGGAITAGLFLTNFVDKKKPFAHIDIAGPVWNDATGATGYGAKLVTEWVCRKGKGKEETES